MSNPTQILLVEDHRILREGLRAILEAQPDLAVLGEAADGAEAICRARELQPDLVVLDLSMPRMNGLDALADIKRVAADARVLILTAQTGDEYVFSALRAGAERLSCEGFHRGRTPGRGAQCSTACAIADASNWPPRKAVTCSATVCGSASTSRWETKQGLDVGLSGQPDADLLELPAEGLFELLVGQPGLVAPQVIQHDLLRLQDFSQIPLHEYDPVGMSPGRNGSNWATILTALPWPLQPFPVLAQPGVAASSS